MRSMCGPSAQVDGDGDAGAVSGIGPDCVGDPARILELELSAECGVGGRAPVIHVADG